MSKAPTAPTRIDADLFASAQVVGPVMSRSAAQQINHWARVGRELEASPTVSHAAIREALAGQRPYDDLSEDEQAIVRAEWSDRLLAEPDGVDLTEAFAAEGRSYVGLDDDGTIAHYGPAAEPEA